ncbi:glucokinase [Aquincola sp. MAHUQ-54]|uniref:Glucokinase n=1 Tax=Aquincola agrisoli TaxID=3119538 RepID=A0AAW9Q9J2_9BURK
MQPPTASSATAGRAAGAPFPRLVGDVGGTNARFAVCRAPDAPPSDVQALSGSDFPTLQAALRRYLDGWEGPPPKVCAIAIANPVQGDRVQMTNHTWSFSIEAVRREFGFDRFVVVNDFVALALALPTLAAHDLRPVGGGAAVPGATCGLLGAGTGLGVASLAFTHRGEAVAVGGEGGHVTLPASHEGPPEEAAVVARLHARFGHASAERALSGPGIVNLYGALAEVRGVAAPLDDPADILAAARGGQDALASAVQAMFCGLLGSVAGNLALTVGAQGGLYIGGGIVPRLGDALAQSTFRARFEAKGRFRGYLERIPSWVITAEQSPALLGASQALDAA